MDEGSWHSPQDTGSQLHCKEAEQAEQRRIRTEPIPSGINHLLMKG